MYRLKDSNDGEFGFPDSPDIPLLGLAENIVAGHTVRVKQKSTSKKPAHEPPKPYKPGYIKEPRDKNLSKCRTRRAYGSSLRHHGAVLTDRQERMAIPTRRRIIYLWRDYKDTLSAHKIHRIREMLDADVTFKPDQAYAYFTNVRKGRKQKQKKNFMEMYVSSDRRHMWVLNASVSFARGIQQRLNRPGVYNLEDGMQRLSNIILQEMSCFIHKKPPSRTSRNRKDKFMIEMADKVAVWIDEILAEADDRMLMMDVDEDDEVTGMYDGFTDEFLNMMGGGQGVMLLPPKPAYLKYKDDMAKAFKMLTEEMYKKDSLPLLSHGKFDQNYKEAADELKRTLSFGATEYSTEVAQKVNNALSELVQEITPPVACMKDMIDICANYLAQNAEKNKRKGAAFKFLVKKMMQKGGQPFDTRGKIVKKMRDAAQMLIDAPSLETDHDDPNLSQEYYSKLEKLVAHCTPYDLRTHMTETLEVCSKYLSQAFIDLDERGPAFDILIKELEKNGGDVFAPEYSDLPTKYDAARALNTAPRLSVESPDTFLSKKFQRMLHAAVDGATPRTMLRDMNDVIQRCGDYLADYVRYRGFAKDLLMKSLRNEPKKEIIQRNDYKMTQGEAADEIDAAPLLSPAVVLKDIAEELQAKMTKAVAASKPAVPEVMKTAMKALIKDAAGQLSQTVGLKSGVAGHRFGHNLVTRITKTMGNKELTKYKDFTQTYIGAGDELEMAGSPLKEPKDANSNALQKEILDEMNTTMRSRLLPNNAAALNADVNKASKHIAATTVEKGDALDWLMSSMKEKGHENFGRLQGFMQSHAEAAQRVEYAPSLANEKVDKGAYDTVKSKAAEAKPNAAVEKAMPEVIEDVAKFLGAPPPETSAEKKRMLGGFLNQKEADTLIAEEGMYKMTYQDAAKAVTSSPSYKIRSHDDRRKKVIEKNLKDALPNVELQEFLKGDALKAIVDSLKSEGDNKFLSVGQSQKTYKEAAEMLENARNFNAARAPPGVAAQAEKQIREMNVTADSSLGQAHMDDATNIAAKYIAGEMAKEAGMVPGKIGEDERLAARVKVTAKPTSGGETESQRKARLEAEKILGRPETPEEQKRRLEIERKLGRPETPEELRARLDAEKKLGRPETEEEFRKRIDAEDLKKYGPETDAQKQSRLDAEKILGRPETDQERKNRLEAEKRLGRPETPEEMRARMEAEERLGRPETEEEFKKRIAGQAKGGDGSPATGETEFQRKARLEAEKILGRPETPEERKRRLEIERKLGRPETTEELRARLDAEKKLGRPETEDEFRKRIDAEDLKKYGTETDAQKQSRLDAEKILGRPETDQERKNRLEAENRLGRPETPEEMRARMEAEKRLGRLETEEEFKKRIAEQAKGGEGSPATGETEFQRKARLEAEKILGRPETAEERKRRLEIERKLGRPETPEELRARLDAEKKLGRPETEEEFRKRIDAEDLKKHGPETDAQKQSRLAAEKILGRPETDQERKNRLQAEKRLGRPETSEEMRARMEAEKRLGRPETEEEFKKRIAGQTKEGDGSPATGETEFQRKARLEAEKILGRPETPEERKRRLEIERRLGRPETPEELRARLDAEKKLGRPETEEEFRKRIDAEDLKKYGPETDAQKQSRLAAEKILGRPETDQERKNRLEAEKRLGRPETPEEMRTRMEAEKRLGRLETEEEFKKRIAGQAKGWPATGETESPSEKASRLAAEKILGRPETPEERQRRLSIERRLGRPETEEEYRARIRAERLLGRAETPQERKARLEVEARLGRPETEAEYRKRMGSAVGVSGYIDDPEREAAMQLLLKELKSKGSEVLYEQPKIQLTHSKAFDWLKKAPTKVNRSVKESGDTARLTHKFERKLGALMEKVTPQQMKDVMQDVIVDSARRLSEYFVAQNYSALVADAFIAELQRRGNEILIEANGGVETAFFAAQRLKSANPLDANDPNEDLAYKLAENLTELVKCCTISRKLYTKLKEHVITASDYLSKHVTKPDPKIEAYVALLQEMEAAGDQLIIDGEIKKSYKDAASYLRKLTTYEDEICRPNSDIQSRTESNLKKLMSKVAPVGYSDANMASVITENAKLLTSYIMLQVEKTEALKVIINRMDSQGNNVLLRHGIVRKSYTEGADTMRGKNTDQLTVTDADPVAARKLQIKLNTLMQDNTPDKFRGLMEDVIKTAMEYLAVALLQPNRIKVCKCKTSVFVQCELWCEEILRSVARPCCTCSRHVSTQALDELAPAAQLAVLAPAARLRITPSQTRAFAPGLDIEVTQCPTMARNASPSASCPAVNPCPGLTRSPQRSIASYMVYETTRDRDVPDDPPERLPRHASYSYVPEEYQQSPLPIASTMSIFSGAWKRDKPIRTIPETGNLEYENRFTDKPTFQNNPVIMYSTINSGLDPTSSAQLTDSILTNSSTPKSRSSTQDVPSASASRCLQKLRRPVLCTARRYSMVSQNTRILIHSMKSISKPSYQYTPNLPTTTTDQMSDWHSTMVSLVWNARAWSGWVQNIVDRAVNMVPQPDDDWVSFQGRVTLEADQWRQYNQFSRQLTLRLTQRYHDKRIVSPVQGTEKTHIYLKQQLHMLEIIDMFSRWTRWIILIIKDTESIKQPVDSDMSLNQLRWRHFARKVQQNAEDWAEYNRKLQRFWDYKFNRILSEWLPSWKVPGPLWVVSACGAVPSGAVPAGMHDKEIIWLARTTHKSEVVPAALVPSKQCCIVYAEETVHHYTKYQVMCNTKIDWVPWRGGVEGCCLSARAVWVAAGVHVGRVRYRGTHLVGAVRASAQRCHVVILGRAFAFNCYDLLVLANDENGDIAP